MSHGGGEEDVRLGAQEAVTVVLLGRGAASETADGRSGGLAHRISAVCCPHCNLCMRP